MADGSLLDVNYSEKELNIIRKIQKKIHQKSQAFIKKVCPFQNK